MPFLCSLKFPLTKKYTIDLSDCEKNVETCTMLVNNSTNINKPNNHLLPQFIEHRKRS